MHALARLFRMMLLATLLGLLLAARSTPVAADDDDDSPRFSRDPTDYLLFDTGDIAADGDPALDEELLTAHGWRTVVSEDPRNAEYDNDGPRFGVMSIFSPLLGTNVSFDLDSPMTGVTYQADIYDDLDEFAYTNVRFIDSSGENGGEIAIWTDEGFDRGGSVEFYSVWDGTWHTTSLPRTKGWHTFTIHVQGTFTSFTIDAQLVHTDTAPRATDMKEAGLFSSTQTAPSFDETQEVWFDNIFVWRGSPQERPIADDDDFADGDDDDGGLSSESLLAYWPFDEGSGTLAQDVTGNGNDGTVNGASYVEGVFGSALEFERTSEIAGDFVETPFLIPGFGQDTELTITLWFRTSSAHVQDFMGYFAGSGADIFTPRLLPPNHTSIGMRSIEFPPFRRKSVEGESCVAMNDGEWHHIAFTHNAAGEFDIYLDGLPLEKTITADDILVTFDQTQNWYLGAVNDTQHSRPSNPFDGTLDEIKIYGSTLTALEIAEEAEQGDVDDLECPDQDDDDDPDDDDPDDD